MSLTKEEKSHLFNLALKLSEAYGHGGMGGLNPALVLKDFYETLKEMREDVEKK